MPGMDHSQMPGMDHGAMRGMDMLGLPKNSNRVPLFPQDAFMEGPMMAMDKEVDKPETHGLPAGWSGFMGGMMTLVRVLPPGQYENIMELIAKHRAQASQENSAR
jgi:manganese oxidase